MPETTTTAPTPPATETPPSRASFASCPPEDEREALTARDTVSGEDVARSSTGADATQDERVTTQQPTPEPDTPVEAMQAPTTAEKARESLISDLVDEAAGDTGSPNVNAPQNESESRSISSASVTAPPLEIPQPMYMSYPRKQDWTAPRAISSFLRPGSKFKGTQKSDRQVYEVQVEIKDVDMAESFCCGYLRIQGLTDDHPTLTTFFEGEIIGPKYLFKTSHPSWGSSEKVDMLHWARFPAWRPLAKSAKSPTFAFNDHEQREHLFMRWKEYFLVPDHRVKTITGASFEGFYYICFNQCSGSVSGIYFHAKSEKYQQLELQHVDDMGCMPAIQFR